MPFGGRLWTSARDAGRGRVDGNPDLRFLCDGQLRALCASGQAWRSGCGRRGCAGGTTRVHLGHEGGVVMIGEGEGSGAGRLPARVKVSNSKVGASDVLSIVGVSGRLRIGGQSKTMSATHACIASDSVCNVVQQSTLGTF
jgi:hypothetical protein